MFVTPLVFLVLFIHFYQVPATMSPVLSTAEQISCTPMKAECKKKSKNYCRQVCKTMGCKMGHCRKRYSSCQSPSHGPWTCICRSCPPTVETNITLTWGTDVMDLDLHAMAIPDDGSTPVHVSYANMVGPGISLDWDNRGFGFDGPEVDTLNDLTINKETVYAIAVHYYYPTSGIPDPNNTILLSSGALVSVTNGRQPNEFEFLNPGHGPIVPSPENFWFVGCVTVDFFGLFDLITPSTQTFFHGWDKGQWYLHATNTCGAYPHPPTADPITLPLKV